MSTTLEQTQYGFDRDSRRTWQKRPLTDTQDLHHDYDALSQVTGSARGSLNLNTTAISAIPAATESWDYDPTGNWRGYNTAANGTPALNQHRVHDRGNRMTQIEGSSSPTILDRVGRMRQTAPDAAGNWNAKLELEWDAWSRITAVKSNGSYVGAFTYDGLHRRITRTVFPSSVVWHSYYSDTWKPLEERKNTGTTPAISYLWGARHRDDLVRRDRAVGGGITLNETRYVLMDYFNPVAITDESGVVKERYAFSAFGIRSILAPDFTPRTTSECAFEFAFQGQFIDTESGLMNYGYRYFSPYLGRWACKDPISEAGGVNLYACVDNGPVNRVDHLGLAECCANGAKMATDAAGRECCPDKMGKDAECNDSCVSNEGINCGAGPGGGKKDPGKGGGGKGGGGGGKGGGGGGKGGGGKGGGGGGGGGGKGGGGGNKIMGVMGKIWNGPNTALGLAFGGLGMLGGAEPSIGNNAIQFENNPLTMSGITLGNAISYAKNQPPSQSSPESSQHDVGQHEAEHTKQGEILGPAYLPANVIGGMISLITSGSWHGNNFMEKGPMSDPPRKW